MRLKLNAVVFDVEGSENVVELDQVEAVHLQEVVTLIPSDSFGILVKRDIIANPEVVRVTLVLAHWYLESLTGVLLLLALLARHHAVGL